MDVKNGVLLHDHQVKSFGYVADDIVRNGLVLNLSGNHPKSVDAGNPSTWLDMTGRNKITCFNSPSFVNNCIYFDAALSQYADIGEPLNLSETLFFTLEAWIKVAPLISHDQVIFGTAGSATGYLRFGANPANFGLTFAMNFANGLGALSTANFPRTPDDTYHCVFTREYNTLTLYANGQRMSTTTGSSDYGIATIFINAIGRYASQYLTGNIFAARIYNRPLNSNEVLYNYNKNLNRIFL